MVLTRSMATTSNAQGDELPRSTALERQVQTLMTAVERLTKQNHDLEDSYVKGMQDLTLRNETRKVTVPSEGSRRIQRTATSQADRSGKTRAFRLSRILPPYLSSRRCRR